MFGAPTVLWRRSDEYIRALSSLVLSVFSSLAYFPGLMDWGEMGSFPSFPAERTSLFHPRLTGFLFSSPPSNVRALKSAANQSFMVFWGQFDIHALLLSLQQLQGGCPKKWASCADSFSLFLAWRKWQCNEKRYSNETQWRSFSLSPTPYLRGAEIVKRQGEWQGTKKDYCETAAFYERAPPTFVSFSQMKFRCSFNGILSHLDWFTFIAFIAQIRGKWWGQRGGAASLLKRN